MTQRGQTRGWEGSRLTAPVAVQLRIVVAAQLDDVMAQRRVRGELLRFADR